MKISGYTLFSNKAEGAGILLFLLLAVLPLLFGMGYALLYSLGSIGILSEGLTLNYWQNALGDMELWRSFAYTFYLSLVTIGLTILAALSLTLYLRKQLQRGVPAFSLYVPL
ncbi:MAG: hypothetical protein R3224_06570, partial [Balneolaceae bacterium]|nr:hypothetical protein [Balneolaceae bacterium]